MGRLGGECCGCLEMAPLLRPVAIETPYGDGKIPLCMRCRTGWRDDQYGRLADPHRPAATPEREEATDG